MEEKFRKILKYLLLATALTPLIVTSSTPFPFVAGKTFFYRGIIELAVLVVAAYFLIRLIRPIGPIGLIGPIGPIRRISPIGLFLVLFLFSVLLSTTLAVNPYRAFFGDIDRGEGFLGMLHYFVFLVLGLVFFKKDDWLNFFKISLVVLPVMVLYAWLQFFGVTNFPFALGSSSQPGSFTGNPAFFSSYLIISLALAAAVFFNSASRTFWRYFSLVVTVLAVATVFLTGIRGAILGILVGLFILGIYFLFREKQLRVVGAGVLVLLILFAGVFWFTRTADFWQDVPGLKRFARASFDIPSVTTRLLALGVSWEAFKERPILGWGPENYSIAYNKHYDPRYSLYAEDWFDRAHNKIAEIGVIQGGLGLIVYLGLFISLFAVLFRRKIPGYAFLAAVFAAYFVQNLFLFDNVTSYIPFFAILGFLIVQTSTAENPSPPAPLPRSAKHVTAAGALILMALVFYSLYSYLYLPYRQSAAYTLATRLRVGDKILAAADNFLYPYSFVQLTIRSRFHDFLYDNGLFGRQQFRPLIDKSLAALGEAVNREPYDPRNFARLIEGYNELAKAEGKFFEQSRILAEQAIALSPRRQGLYSHLAFALAGEKRYEEAIAVDRRSVELAPNSAKAHLNLGITLSLAAEDEKNKGTPTGEAYKKEALKELDRAFELGRTVLGGSRVYEGENLSNTQFLLFIESDFKNMLTIYRVFDQLDKVFEVLKIALNDDLGTAENRDFLHDGIILGRLFRDKEAIIKYARRLKEIEPALADDMDVIIDLTEKEKWEILDTL